MGESNIKEISQVNFDELLKKSDRLVIVKFYTTTCPVCQAMVPVYGDVAKELSAKAEFIKMDSSKNMQLAQRFGIMGVPTIKFFCKGKEIGSIVGMTNTTALGNTVKDFIRHGEGCKFTPLTYEMDGYG